MNQKVLPSTWISLKNFEFPAAAAVRIMRRSKGFDQYETLMPPGKQTFSDSRTTTESATRELSVVCGQTDQGVDQL